MSRFDTDLVHPPSIAGEPTGSTSTPIYQTATFDVGDDPSTARWDYSRSGNPTRDVLERQLAHLDGASHAFAYASGLAAVGAVLGLVGAGRQVVVGDDLYGGTVRLLRRLETRAMISVRRVDLGDSEAVARALDSAPTDLVFAETPTNPRLGWVDVEAISRLTRARDVRLAVDNSMLSPALYRPLDFGADIAVQSATKLLGGHGDLTAGVVATRDGRLAESLAFDQNATGSALAPFDSWLLLRGMKTLGLRLERQLATTRTLVARLRRHPEITRVHTVPDGVAPPVVSFETGRVDLSRRLLREVRLLGRTVSFGGVGSSVSLPCEMSHAAIPESERRELGLAPDLVRVAVGIEATDDVVADVITALDRAAGSAAAKRRVRAADQVGNGEQRDAGADDRNDGPHEGDATEPLALGA